MTPDPAARLITLIRTSALQTIEDFSKPIESLGILPAVQNELLADGNGVEVYPNRGFATNRQGWEANTSGHRAKWDWARRHSVCRIPFC